MLTALSFALWCRWKCRWVVTPCDLGEGEPALLTLGQLTASKWQEPIGIQRDHAACAGFACSGETSVGVSMITQFRYFLNKAFWGDCCCKRLWDERSRERVDSWHFPRRRGTGALSSSLVGKQTNVFLQRQGDLRNPSHGICPLGLIRGIVNYPILTPI